VRVDVDRLQVAERTSNVTMLPSTVGVARAWNSNRPGAS
jgi:hypothetical protein